MDITEACKIILPKFMDASRNVWRNWDSIKDNITIKCELKVEKSNNLASLSWDTRCKQRAMYNGIYRYCREYTLQLSPRFMKLPEDRMIKVLKHEAIHMGYRYHNQDFLELASKVGATSSEASFDTTDILIEVRGDNGRYRTVMTAQTPEDARRLAMGYHFKHPTERVRITY